MRKVLRQVLNNENYVANLGWLMTHAHTKLANKINAG